jgi:hypothetical protein
MYFLRVVALTWGEVHIGPILCMLGVGNTMSPDLANPVWRLAYHGFEKIVFDIDTLLNDNFDRVTVFVTSAHLRPRLHGAA